MLLVQIQSCCNRSPPSIPSVLPFLSSTLAVYTPAHHPIQYTHLFPIYSFISSIISSSFPTPDDDVFIADEMEREEFVINSSGQMWVGSHDNNSPTPWEYDQVSSYRLSKRK